MEDYPAGIRRDPLFLDPLFLVTGLGAMDGAGPLVPPSGMVSQPPAQQAFARRG